MLMNASILIFNADIDTYTYKNKSKQANENTTKILSTVLNLDSIK